MPEDNRTEKATSKKRRDERNKGNVFKSQDVITVLSLLGSFIILDFFASTIYLSGKEFLLECITYVSTMNSLSNEAGGYVLWQLLIAGAKACLPLLLVSMLVGILSTGIQTKFLFRGKNAAPKFNRINPIEGMKKLLSLRSLIGLFKSLIKITILLSILYQFLKKLMPGMIRTMGMALESSTAYMMDSILKMVIQISMCFVVIAAFDYMYEHWEYERQIKMTKQEVKEEYKQLEGDPKIKGKIRSIQQERARNRMMQAVPQADVIVRNPTHFAVALKYDIDKDNAPILLAKGQDLVALRIVAIGEENNIEIVENKPLARAIYASTEINREIPPELYGMVAELLVYIYKLKTGKGKI